MVSSSRGLALIFGVGLAALATIILSPSLGLGLSDSAIAFLLLFVIATASAFAVLEIFVFRGLRSFGKTIDRLKQGDVSEEDTDEVNHIRLEPVARLEEEIVSIAARNQEEIERLKKLESFRKEFIANVSHELKTPIFAAQGFVHTLLDGAVNDKAVRMKFLKKAARSLDGLDVLVEDLLVLSQIETGQIKMHFENFDIYKLTEEVFEQFDDKLSKKRIELRIENSHGPLMVYGDSQRIAQVLTNLVSNAIRHSFDDSEVLVTFEQLRKYVKVSVKDFGEGIPEEDQSRIFERFYRVDKSRTKDKGKGGTGLGLAIVKHILEGHETKADVESEPGRGSVFSFKLPRFKTEPES